MINWLMCTGYASRHDNLRRIPHYIKENNHLYLSGGSVFSSHFPWVRLLYHYLCQWRPLWNISDCKHPVRVRRWKSFHCKSCHSLHAPSLPPNSPSNINPLHFYLPPNFILTETLSATLSRSLVISLRGKKTTCLAHCLFLSFSLSPLLNFTSPLLGLFLSLSFALCVCLLEAARERERESSASFLTHWLISARPSLGSTPTPTGDPGAGEKQEVGCVWWRQFTGGVVWLRPLGLYCQAQPMPISRAGDIELLLP